MADWDEKNFEKMQNKNCMPTQADKGGNYDFSETTNISSGIVAAAFGQADPIFYSLQKGYRVRIYCKFIVEGNKKSDVRKAARHIRKQYGGDWERYRCNGNIACADDGVSTSRSIDSDSFNSISKEPEAVGFPTNDIEVNKKKNAVVIEDKNGNKDEKSFDSISGDRIRKHHARDWKNNTRNGNNRASVDRGPQNPNSGAGACIGHVSGVVAKAATRSSIESGTLNKLSKQPKFVSLCTKDVKGKHTKDSVVFEENNGNKDNKTTDPISADHIRKQYDSDSESNTDNDHHQSYDGRGHQIRNGGTSSAAATSRSIDSDSFQTFSKEPEVVSFSGNVDKNSKVSVVFEENNGNKNEKSSDMISGDRIRKENARDWKNNTRNGNKRAFINRGPQRPNSGAGACVGHVSDVVAKAATIRTIESSTLNKLSKQPKFVSLCTKDVKGKHTKDSVVFEENNGNKDNKTTDPISADHIRKQYDSDSESNTDNDHHQSYDGRGHHIWNGGTSSAAATSRFIDSDSFQTFSKEPEVVSFSGNVDKNSKVSVVFEENNGNKDEKSSDLISGDRIRKENARDWKNNTRNGNKRAFINRGPQGPNSDGGAWIGHVSGVVAKAASIRTIESSTLNKLSEPKFVSLCTKDVKGKHTKDSVVFEENNGNKDNKTTDPISADHIRKQYDSDSESNTDNDHHQSYDGRGHQIRNGGTGSAAATSRSIDLDSFQTLSKEPEVVSFSGNVDKNSNVLVVFEENNDNKDEKSSDSTSGERIRKENARDWKNNTRNGNNAASIDRGPQRPNSGADACIGNVSGVVAKTATRRSIESGTLNKLSEPNLASFSTKDEKGRNPKDSVVSEEINGNKDNKTTDPLSADHIRKQYESDSKNNTIKDHQRIYDGRGYHSRNAGTGGGAATSRSIDSDSFQTFSKEPEVVSFSGNVDKNSKVSVVFEENNGNKDGKSSDSISGDRIRKENARDWKNNTRNGNPASIDRGPQRPNSSAGACIGNVSCVVTKAATNKTTDPISADYIRKQYESDCKINTNKEHHRTYDGRRQQSRNCGTGSAAATSRSIDSDSFQTFSKEPEVVSFSGNVDKNSNVSVVFEENNDNKDEKSSDSTSGERIRKENARDWKNNTRNGNNAASIDRGPQRPNSGADACIGNVSGVVAKAATRRTIESGTLNKLSEPKFISLCTKDEKGRNPKDSVVSEEINGNKDNKTTDPISADYIRKQYESDCKINTNKEHHRTYDGRRQQSRNGGTSSAAATSSSIDSDSFQTFSKEPEVVSFSGNVDKNSKVLVVFEENNGNKDEKSSDSISGDRIRKDNARDWKNNTHNGNPTSIDHGPQRPNSGAGACIGNVSCVFTKAATNKTTDPISADYIRKQYESDCKINTNKEHHRTYDGRRQQSRNGGTSSAAAISRSIDSDSFQTFSKEPEVVSFSGNVDKNSKVSVVFEENNGNKDEKSSDSISGDRIRKENARDWKNNTHNGNPASIDHGPQRPNSGAGACVGHVSGVVAKAATIRTIESSTLNKLSKEPKFVSLCTKDEKGRNPKDSLVSEEVNGNKDNETTDPISADHIHKQYDSDSESNTDNDHHRTYDGRGHQSRNGGTGGGAATSRSIDSDSFQTLSKEPEVVSFSGNVDNNSKVSVIFEEKAGNKEEKIPDPISASHVRDYKNITCNCNYCTYDDRRLQSRSSVAGTGDGVATSRYIDSDSFKKLLKEPEVVIFSFNGIEANNSKDPVVFDENGKKDEKTPDPISADRIRKQYCGDYKNITRNANNRTYDDRGHHSRNGSTGSVAFACTSTCGIVATSRSIGNSESCSKLTKEPEVVRYSINDEEDNNSKVSVVFEENNGNKDEKTTDPISSDRIRKQYGGVYKSSTCNGNQRASEGLANQYKNREGCAAAGAATARSVASNSFTNLSEPEGVRFSTKNVERIRNVNNNTKDSAVFEKKKCKKEEKICAPISADHSRKQYGGDHKNNTRNGNQHTYHGRECQTRNSAASGGVGKNGRRYDFGGHDYKGSSRNSQIGETPLIDWDAFNKKSAEARVARWSKCPKLTKDFYNEKPEVSSLSADDVERMRIENNNTKVSLAFEEKNDNKVEKIPNPIWTFEQCFDAYPDLMVEIAKQGFKKPSPIQCQAWPILLKGNDMIGISQTGTGKTLAFLFPAMIHTEYQSKPRGQRGGPNVLVLAPTRELAIQIESEVKKYSFRDMKAVCVYGGGDRRLQINDVERGAEIIICTPGRLNDLIQAKVIDVSTITFLILDEADRMLDMGFEPQIRKVMLDIRPDRQTVMTSATWPAAVRRLAKSYMKNPIQVCIGSLDLAATHSVTQIIKFMSDDEEKYRSIKKFIEKMTPNDKAIVFCGRKGRADDLSSDLAIAGYMTACIHGNRDQHDREQAISDIKTGMIKLLVATDVASRGLDIEDITYVINYDLPRTIEEYVHRVGRTGRAGRTGISISYLTREDWFMAQELIVILEEASQEVPDELRNMSERYAAMKKKRGKNLGGGNRHNGYGKGNNNRFRF